MTDLPTTPELVEAAREFLEREILPTFDDTGSSFEPSWR